MALAARGITEDQVGAALNSIVFANEIVGADPQRSAAFDVLIDLYRQMTRKKFKPARLDTSIVSAGSGVRNFIGAECPNCGEVLAVRVGGFEGDEYYPQCPVCDFLPETEEFAEDDE